MLLSFGKEMAALTDATTTDADPTEVAAAAAAADQATGSTSAEYSGAFEVTAAAVVLVEEADAIQGHVYYAVWQNPVISPDFSLE